MAKIIFDVHHHYSHFNAAMKLARVLKSAAHEVSFIGSDDYRDQVVKAGFNYISYRITLPQEDPNSLLGTIKSSIGLNGYKYYRHYVKEFQYFIMQIKPDIVLLDEEINFRSFWYDEIGAKSIIYTTKPYSGPSLKTPPFNSYLIPTGDFANMICILFLWEFTYYRNILKILIDNLKTLYQNDYFYLKRYTKSLKINLKREISFRHVFKWSLGAKPIIVLIPRELDFERTYPTNVFHVGQYGDNQREPLIDNNRYKGLLRLIEKRKAENPDIRTVYCSLGTISYMNRKSVFRFIKRIVQVSRSIENSIFVISVGNFLNFDHLIPLPSNVFIYNVFPQLDLLSKCDLMINHGGMNSVMECIDNYVPQIIYPLSQDWEQPGNSSKILHYQLGLRGRISRDNVTDIRNKIEYILSNRLIYIENIRAFKVRMNSQYSSDVVIDLINDLSNEFKAH